MRSFLKRVALFTLLHLVLTITAILASFGAGMTRFDHPEIQATTTERIANALSNVLPQPAVALIELAGTKGMHPILQWVVLAANSLLWAAALAWITGKLAKTWQRNKVSSPN